MTLHKTEIDYGSFQGFLAKKEGAERPGVVIFHAWRGHDSFVREKAIALAEMGYAAFAADIYGKGVVAHSDEEAMSLMLPLFEDRKLLQERTKSAVETLKQQPGVNPSKIAAIGFCFGGLTAFELLRSGEEIKGIVSFHGLLADKLGNVKAKRPQKRPKMKGAALFLHGNDDPMVSSTDIRNTEHELSEAGIDWQFNTYGHTVHGFTNPEAKNVEGGIVYEPKAAKRAWQSMALFLEEIFQ